MKASGDVASHIAAPVHGASAAGTNGPPEAEGRAKRRLGEKDWEIAAIEAIATGGVGAVAVEPLARGLGVTKGSFYWHFRNVDALLAAALARWERVFVDRRLESLAEVEGPRDRLRAVFTDAATDTRYQAVSLAIAAAADNPLVQPVLTRITHKWVGCLHEAYREMGVGDPLARDRAVLLYAAYHGLMHLVREVPGVVEDVKVHIDRVFEMLVP